MTDKTNGTRSSLKDFFQPNFPEHNVLGAIEIHGHNYIPYFLRQI